MNIRCLFTSYEGEPCKRWAMRGSNFCHAHRPPQHPFRVDDGIYLHPLARLATPEDIFDVLRETLNATRQGRIPPKQAYAVAYLARTLLDVRKEVAAHVRQEALYRQMLPTLADEDAAAEIEAADAMPLPVAIDESASTAAPPPPSTPEEAQDMYDKIRAQLGPIPPEEIAETKRMAAERDAACAAAAAARNAAAGNGSHR